MGFDVGRLDVTGVRCDDTKTGWTLSDTQAMWCI